MGVSSISKRRIARIALDGVCARVGIWTFIASAVPLSALISLAAGADMAPRLLALTAAATALVALAGVASALRPVLAVAELLERFAGDATHENGRGFDHEKRLLHNAEALAVRLATEQRRADVHPITGLPAREHLLAAIAEELPGRGGAPAMLGLIRVANYEHLTAFDPAAAERMLAAVAERLKRAVSAGRPLAHVDRDCFALWFGGSADTEASRAELEAIGYVLMQELDIAGLSLTPDIQLGSALYPLDAEEPGNLLNRAFVSMARPQRTADGGIAFFAKPSPQEARQRFSLEQDLRQAVRRGELVLHYQPVVDLAIGRVVGCEALLRWRSGASDAVAPAQVVKALEETGLVHEIGLWTLNTACRQLRDWREQGAPPLKIAVNLSAHQLRDRALPAALQRILAAHALPPASIELELTETAAMEDPSRTYAMLQELREAGFSLAIDDFGSGYSSLAYLRRLPFQKLKIDREFVTLVDQRADSRTICKALIDLTAGLELAVLAEGVERLEEVETLRVLGCATFQGYYFSRPLPADEFLKTVTDTNWLTLMRSRVHREREELRRRLT
jgi:EAL domain-containing protein (putative c-di-GMP-specific phosphodiesterase class I)/GGDEF domain-containing protein